MDRRGFLRESLLILMASSLPAIAQTKETNPKPIYLTIDDGPGKYTQPILDNLKGNHAVFYILGNSLNTKSGLNSAEEIVLRGNILGNHSHSHPVFSRILIDKIKWEIEETDNLIERIYKNTGIKRPIKLFRYPYGNNGNPNNRNQIKNFLNSLDYKIQFWDIDTLDWRYYSKNPLSAGSIMNLCSKANENNIVLVHERGFTANNIIPFYAQSGKYKLILPA